MTYYLQICAEELELGRAIWEAHAAADTLESFCTASEGQRYLMALGNVRFASCALASAIRQPSVATSVGFELWSDSSRCSSAWDAPTEGKSGVETRGLASVVIWGCRCSCFSCMWVEQRHVAISLAVVHTGRTSS